MNAHKTQAISLSEAPLPEWDALLAAAGYPPCHDQTQMTPLIYLGFPLASSRRQLSSFLDELIAKIKQDCQLVSEKSDTDKHYRIETQMQIHAKSDLINFESDQKWSIFYFTSTIIK